MTPDTFAALVTACTAALESVNHGEAGMRVSTYGSQDGSHCQWFRVWHRTDETGIASSVCVFPHGEGADHFIVHPYLQTDKGSVARALQAETAWCNRVHKALHKALRDFRKGQEAEAALARLALARAA